MNVKMCTSAPERLAAASLHAAGQEEAEQAFAGWGRGG